MVQNCKLSLFLSSSLLLLASLAGAQGWDSNDFLIAGFNSDNIAIYDENFTFKGFLDPSFNGVVPLDFTSSGNAVAAGRTPGEVREYDSAGTLVNSFTSGDLSLPIDGKTGPSDLYYVGTQSTSLAVRELDLSGTSIRSFGTGTPYVSVAILPGGILWAGGQTGTIDLFDVATGLTTGTIVLDNGQVRAKSMFYSAATDTVLTTDSGSVFERTASGAFVRRFTGFNISSSGVTRGPGDDVFATDCGSGSVNRWRADGTFVRKIALPELSCPAGIAWTGNSQLSTGVNLAITNDDGVSTVIAGQSVTYTITASNAGPEDAEAAMVTDPFPPELSCTWTCAATGGASCTAGPVAGDVADTVDIPAGNSVSYTAVCDVEASATGTLTNTASVTETGGPDPSNSSATDVDTLLPPTADFTITKNDGSPTAVAGESLTYTITVGNGGPGRLFAWDDVAGRIREIDPSNGAQLNNFPSPIGSAGSPYFGMATTATTLLVGGSNSESLFELDAATGATLRTLDNPGVNVRGMAFLGTEIFLLGNLPWGQITVLDHATGSVLRTMLASPVRKGLSASGTGLFGTLNNRFFTIDPLTGETTLIGILGTLESEGAGIIGSELFIAESLFIKVFDLETLTPLRTLSGLGYLQAVGADGASASVDAVGATVTDLLPPEISCSWTCTPSGTASCNPGPITGDIDDSVDIPAGDSVIYLATCDVDVAATGVLTNTATVTPPAGLPDPNPSDNSSTDVNTLHLPNGEIFSDGFESGDTSAWSSSVP